MDKRHSTESDSGYSDLEKMSTEEIVSAINREDATVAMAVALAAPSIVKLIDAVYERMRHGGRLFYIGSGTSGRLGIVDASECPPTFGVPHDMVIGIIAGGDTAIRKAVEFAEDDHGQAWADLKAHQISAGDFVIGISASGRTPYVKGGLTACVEEGIGTGSIACNAESEIGKIAEHAVEIIVGPEVVTGSTRMKSGTAQKMVLNMISSAVMIKLGRVRGNKMVDMQLSNVKLIDRGTRMIMNETQLDYEQSRELLLRFGSVRRALESLSE